MLGHGGSQPGITVVAEHQVEREQQSGRTRIVQLALLPVAHPEPEPHAARCAAALVVSQ